MLREGRARRGLSGIGDRPCAWQQLGGGGYFETAAQQSKGVISVSLTQDLAEKIPQEVVSDTKNVL